MSKLDETGVTSTVKKGAGFVTEKTVQGASFVAEKGS